MNPSSSQFVFLWIRIHAQILVGWSRIHLVKNGLQKKKKAKKFIASKSWMFFFEGWRLLVQLGCPSWRPRVNIMLFDKIIGNFSTVKSYNFWSKNPGIWIRNWIGIRIRFPIDLKFWIRMESHRDLLYNTVIKNARRHALAKTVRGRVKYKNKFLRILDP